MTLSDLERRGVVRGQNFLADVHNYVRMVWLRMTEFGVVTPVGSSMGSDTPTSQGDGSQRLQNFWAPYLYAEMAWPTATKYGIETHVGEERDPNIFGTSYMCTWCTWETVTKFCMVINLDEGIIFEGLTTHPALAKNFVTRMLTLMFAVANLVTSVCLSVFCILYLPVWFHISCYYLWIHVHQVSLCYVELHGLPVCIAFTMAKVK